MRNAPRNALVVLTLLGVYLVRCSAQDFYQPEQIHLSYGDDPTEMVVTWVTLTKTNSTMVEYGEKDLNTVVKGTEDTFIDGGKEKRNIYIHRAKMINLKPGSFYVYHVGGVLGWSSTYYFTALRSGTDWSPRFAVYGDMGNVNAKSLATLQEEAQRGNFDAVLHVGDFAYNMDTDNARVGDAFMNQIQPVSAYLPYMTLPGNHENTYNFSNYQSRFTMPGGDGHNMFYSFNVGPVHIVAFSSEYYYYTEYGWLQIANQYKWLENDLREANKPENRAQRPWVITMCHRPLYCSNSDDPQHCPNTENIIRVGLPYIHAYGIEDLLYKYGVDLHFQAHEHSYERMFPVYNLTVCNGTGSDPYLDPDAPVHIVTGSGGCQEGEDPFEKIPHPWSAAHSDDYGFTRLTVHNSTHLGLQQVSVDKGDAVIDEMTLIKTHHAPYTCHTKKNATPYKMPDIKFTGTRDEYRKLLHANRSKQANRTLRMNRTKPTDRGQQRGANHWRL